MKKSLLYRLFKAGTPPKELKPILEREGLELFDEGIGGCIILRNFKSPGRRSRYRKSLFTGFLALTGSRLVGYAFRRPVINVTLNHDTFKVLSSELVNPGRIEISFDAVEFHEDWAGQVTVRFDTAKAAEFHQAILKHQGS